jgi:hypothetical protein
MCTMSMLWMDDKVCSPLHSLILMILHSVNASYSLYWDIVMDWGMMQNPSAVFKTACGGGTVYSELLSTPQNVPGSSQFCHKRLLRPRLRYGVAISSWIFLTDCILRFSWLLRFAHHLFPSSDAFVMFTQFLEVFRRSLWNLLRVEWENLKQKNSGTRLIDEEDDDDDDRGEVIELQRPVLQKRAI